MKKITQALLVTLLLSNLLLLGKLTLSDAEAQDEAPREMCAAFELDGLGQQLNEARVQGGVATYSLNQDKTIRLPAGWKAIGASVARGSTTVGMFVVACQTP